jgi:hypothetical protein
MIFFFCEVIIAFHKPKTFIYNFTFCRTQPIIHRPDRFSQNHVFFSQLGEKKPNLWILRFRNSEIFKLQNT